MMERFWSLFYARNMEYFRDRSALAWSLLFPFLLLLGFYFMFDRDAPPDQVKVALTGRAIDNWQQRIDDLPYVSVVKVDKISVAREKLAHHKVHLVLDTGSKPMRYWVSETSVQSYLAERLVIRELQHQAGDTLQSKTGPAYERLTMTGEEIPYLEWFFPGILGMNLMFSAIFGVGYVIVRYRKNGVLKRISVTPVSAFEFLAAQIASRMFLTAFMTGILLGGGMLLFGFQVRGSWLALLLLFFWGSASLCAAGLWVAARHRKRRVCWRYDEPFDLAHDVFV